MAAAAPADRFEAELQRVLQHIARLGHNITPDIVSEVRQLAPEVGLQMLQGLCEPTVRSPAGYLRHRLAVRQRDVQQAASATPAPGGERTALPAANEEHVKRIKTKDVAPRTAAAPQSSAASSHAAPAASVEATQQWLHPPPADTGRSGPPSLDPALPAAPPGWSLQNLRLGHRCCPGCGEQSDVAVRTHAGGRGILSVRGRTHAPCGANYVCVLKEPQQHGIMVCSVPLAENAPQDWQGAGRYDVVARHIPHCFVCGLQCEMAYSAAVMDFVHVVQFVCPQCDSPFTGCVLRQGAFFLFSYAGTFG